MADIDEPPEDDFLAEDLPAEEEENRPAEEEPQGPTTKELLLWRARAKRGARRQRLGKPPIQYEDEQDEGPEEAPGERPGAGDAEAEKGAGERQADEMISLLRDIVTAQEEQIAAIEEQTKALQEIVVKLDNLGKFGD